MKTEVDVKPDILNWAITRAGMELDEFASKFPKVLDWIEERKKPTLKQLEEFSRKVHLPFGYLFLTKPIEEKLTIPFFRTGQAQPTTKVSVNVYDTILLMQQRQDWLRDYLKENNPEDLDFVGRFKGGQNVQEIVEDIRAVIGLQHEWASLHQNFEAALDHLARKIEEVGIITCFNGVVENNTKRPIEVDECRGFVLVDRLAPLMFVNNADGKAAQLFTIVHELAHIWIGHSAGFDFRQLLPADDPIELLCDKVAAEFLVPRESFNRVWSAHSDIPYLGRYFKVSQIVIARRALDLGKINRTTFFNFYNSYLNQLRTKKEKKASGGDFYATTKKRLSLTFAAHVDRAVKTNQLLYRDAYKLTSLKGDTFKKFFDEHFKVK